ncbi:hypothetical protein [Burkholderia sp. Bp9012]|uniref:hypothetical protein n=1 Tax=Burkholderia sp. Bp9012 TaxID=2184562 RepID=UPI0016276F3A|nr:hypothetical protein [Burkholderia sp. Bp9012]
MLLLKARKEADLSLAAHVPELPQDYDHVPSSRSLGLSSNNCQGCLSWLTTQAFAS